MAKGRVRLLKAIPGPTSLNPIIRQFTSGRDGVITTFSDTLLPSCAALVDENSYIEVKSFGEVVRQALEMCGEYAFPLAQSGHCVATTALVCEQLEESSPFWKTRQFPGLHEALWRTVKELLEWGIDADEMLSLRDRATPRLGAKLESMAKVASEVTRILEQVGRQTHASHLASCLEGTPELDGSLERLLVFAGSEDDFGRVRWLKWIAEGGVDLTVVIDRHASGAQLFGGATRIEQWLGVKAQDMGDGNALARNLFSDKKTGGPAIDVCISTAADPLAEVEWALRACLGHEDLSRSAIYARNLETYAPLIEMAATRLNVPIQMVRRAPLLTNAFARLTLTTLKFCASDDIRTISPIVRSSYLGLTAEQQTELNSHVREAHGSRNQQWEMLQAWSDAHAEQHPWLTKTLEWRTQALASSVPLSDWFDRLRNLIGELPWHESENLGHAYSSDRDRRAQTQLQRSLANFATVDRVVDGSPMTLARFTDLCESVWSAADVSVPKSEIGVTIANSTEMLGAVDNLYVVGMLEGVFPRRRSEDPILTDDERNEISRLIGERPSLRTSQDTARAERDEFYRLCAVPGARIGFSYPLADDDRDNIPAYYLEKVREAVGLVEQISYPRTMLAPEPGACVAQSDIELRAALNGPRESALSIELSTQVAKEAIVPVQGAAMSPADLRDALTCPFMDVARHRLKLRPRRRGTRWYSLRQLPQVATLPTQMNPSQAEAALLAALTAELDSIYSDVPEWEMQLLVSGGRRLIKDWVRREFASREHWSKDPGSVLMNVGFGAHGLRDSLPGGVKIAGTVPAVASMDNTTVIQLYGGSPKNPAELTDPEKLYLGVHYLAMHEQGREGALEIDGTGSKRTLFLLNRAGTRPLVNQLQDGLEVKELGNQDDPAVSKMEFFRQVKECLRRAMERIHDGRVDAIQGEQCDTCDYGELCRRSKVFGELDSPFGFDTETTDV